MPDIVVTLDEKTDAGEFLYHQIPKLPKEIQEPVRRIVCKEGATAEELAEAVGIDDAHYSLLLTGLYDWGMEFESMARSGDMEEDVHNLSERGVRGAEAFVRAAQCIAAQKRGG